MSHVQQTLCRVRSLKQVPLRLRSTVAAFAEKDAPISTEWENARQFSEVPGPKPLPLIGNMWRFFPVVGDFSGLSIDQFYDRMHKKYGPISKFSGIPGRPDMLMVFDPNSVEQIYRTEGAWPIRRGGYALEYYFKEVRKNYLASLATMNGKEWQDFRSAVNQVMMQPRNAAQYVEPIDTVAQEFIERMRTIRGSDQQMPDNFIEELSKWSLESIALIALDTKMGMMGDPEPQSDSYTLMNCVRGVFDDLYELDFKPSLWRYIPTPAYRRFIRNMNTFTEVAGKYVDAAMERLKTTAPSDMETRQLSVLERILISSEDPSIAVSMALDMLVAGVDTTSGVASFVLYQLARHPDKQAKLQEELDRVVPDRSKPITKQQLEELKYLRACIKETMRVMPIAIANFRDTGKDMVLHGYQIPAGTVTSMSNPAIFSNDEYFPKAKEFIPERWLPSGVENKKTLPFTFLPFGFGPRMCVGKRFADMELEAILSKIFLNFKLEWNQPPAKTKYTLLMQIADPLRFTVKDRP